MMTQLENILSRRSVRSYLEKEVETEKLEKILKAAEYAPTGRNSQPLFFVIVKDKEKKDTILKEAGVEKNFYSAPVLRITFARTEDHLNELNVGAALRNARLEANELDVSSCWIHSAVSALDTPHRRKFLKETLSLKGEYQVFDCLALGYLKGEKPARKERNLDEDKIL